jgi:hypothetical protein
LSLLTTAQAIGLTGTEPPLTDGDIRTVVRRAYSRARAEAALAGHPNGRGSMWGCAGEHNGVHIACMSDGNGIWAHVDDRGGYITWARAERILRDLYRGQLGLFEEAS